MAGSTGTQHAGSWGPRARAWAVTNAKYTAIAGGVGFGIGWLLNVWIMAARYDGFRTPLGAPVTGVGNLLQGTIFYLLVSALLSSVITYRLIAGPERFASEVKGLPANIRQAVTDDGDQTALHALIGLSASMLVVLVLGPSTAAVLAAGSLLAFTPLLRPVVTSGLTRLYMAVLRRLAPGRSRPPASVAMLIGVLGSTGGFALGWLLPGGAGVRIALGLIAGAAAVVLAQRKNPSAGVGVALAMILGGTIAIWLNQLGIAFADDGGFAECGNPGAWRWLTACDGSGSVMSNALVGAAAAGTGAAAGAALGATAGDGDGDDSDGGPEDDLVGPTGPGSSGTGEDEVDEEDVEVEEERVEEEEEEEEEEVPTGPKQPSPFDLDKIKLEDIDWDLMPDEMRERIRRQLIHEWREKNPGADYIRQQEAGREIDSMLSNDGPVLQWMKDAWEFATDAGTLTWEDFKSGGALASIAGAVEGIVEGLKEGAIGILDLVANAPEMVGVAVDFWTSQNPAESVRQIMAEVPGMTRDMAEQFVGMMDELHEAAMAGDNQRVGQIIGKVAGQIEFEIAMGIGGLKAAELGKGMVEGTRIGRAIENAEDYIRGPAAATSRADNAADAAIKRRLDVHERVLGDRVSEFSRFRTIAEQEPQHLERYLRSLSESELKTLHGQTRSTALEYNVGRDPSRPTINPEYLDGIQKIDDLVGESNLHIKWAAEEANAVVRGGDAPYMNFVRSLPPEDLPTFARMFLENNGMLIDGPVPSVDELVATWTRARGTP